MSLFEYNIVAVLAFASSLIIGISKGWHKGGPSKLLAFLIWYGFCFLFTLLGFWTIKTMLNLF